MPRALASVLAVAIALVAAPCAAQSRDCSAIPAPTLTTIPDEPPAVHTPPATTIGRAGAIEAMAVTDPARPSAMFELAEAYRALGRGTDEMRTLARIVQDHPSWPALDRVQFRLGRAIAGGLYELALAALAGSPQLDAPTVRSALGADQGALTATLRCQP